MKYFVDTNGIIFSIGEDGKCNHSAAVQIESDQVHILDGDGGIGDTYTLWDSLHSLAVAIAPSNNVDYSAGLSLHDAVDELHQAAEKFKQDWLDGHEKSPEQYPLSLPSDNIGIYTELFVMSLSE